MDSLAAAGIDARLVAWDDPTATLDPVGLIRSTWNYYHRPEDFLAWVRAYPGAMYNPAEVVAWNLHKGYLLDLAAAGVPVVPTALLRRGSAATLASVAERLGTTDLVVKPAISAGSHLTYRSSGALETVREAYDRLVMERDVLVQPYLSAVETSGERALVWIDGEVTHAVRKSPRFAGGVESVRPVPVTEEQRSFAQRVIAAAPGPLLYARVDVIADAAGQLRVMELELIEPSLFLATSTSGLWRFVDVVARKVRGRVRGEELEA